MVSKEDMAKGYVEQVRSQLNQLKNQVAALEQHIQECEEGLSDESPPESEQNHRQKASRITPLASGVGCLRMAGSRFPYWRKVVDNFNNLLRIGVSNICKEIFWISFIR